MLKSKLIYVLEQTEVSKYVYDHNLYCSFDSDSEFLHPVIMNQEKERITKIVSNYSA